MDNYLIAAAIILSIFANSVLSEADLQEQNTNHDQLNPIHDPENLDSSSKDQDKRTVFNPTIQDYAWAKHVAVRPSGHKYLLGYGPVDLKYAPVIRPIAIKHHGYRYGRPRINFHIKRPAVHFAVKPALQTGWRPVARPAIPVNVPPPQPVQQVHAEHHHSSSGGHLDHVHVKPAQHIDHVHATPVQHVEHIQPVGHVDHIYKVPAAHVDHIHPVAHVDHVHKVPAVHVDHIQAAHEHVHKVPVSHFDHLHLVQGTQAHPVPIQHLEHVHYQPAVHPVPVHVQSVVPRPVVAQTSFVPSALFEVTRPHLGVLPLGSAFPSPVLTDVPAPQVKPALVAQIHPVAHEHPVGHLHHVGHINPVGQVYPPVQPAPAVVPHPPGTLVEYHGNTNVVPLFNGQIPVQAQIHVNAPPPALPSHFHLQYPQIPQQLPEQPNEQHVVQTPIAPSTHQILFHNQPQFQQHLPIDAQPNFQAGGHNIFRQNLPGNGQPQFEAAGHNIFQQNLPVNDQASFQAAGHNVFQQNLPVDSQSQFEAVGNNVFQHQVPDSQSHFQPDQDQVQPQLPENSRSKFQPADQVSSHNFFQQLPAAHQGQFQANDQSDNQGYVYQQPSGVHQQSIQPGQTDVQVPVHLPHHPNLDSSGRQFQQGSYADSSQVSESVFRPSIQLEPPYK